MNQARQTGRGIVLRSAPRCLTLAAVAAFVVALLGPGAVAASDAATVSELNARLSGIRADVLRQRLAANTRAELPHHLYLSVDDDLNLVRANARIARQSADAADTVVFQADNAGRVPLLAREPMAPLTAGRYQCMVVLVVADGQERHEERARCEPFEVAADQTLGLALNSKWLGGVDVETLTWPRFGSLENDADQDKTDENPLTRFSNAVTELSRALDAADSARKNVPRSEFAAKLDSLWPDTLYNLKRCERAPLDSMYRIYAKHEKHGWPSSADFWLGYERCALRAGVRAEALRAIRALRENAPESLEHFEGRWRLARFEFEHGNVHAALNRLDAAPVPAALDSLWRDLKARLLLAVGQPESALEMLGEGRHLAIAGTSLERFDATVLHAAMRMNYAHALLATGRQKDALAVLNRVGTSAATDFAARSIRARANAKLGWHFLREKHGATAVRIFDRIPLDGPHSDEALLGMGWAMLVGRGEEQELRDPPGFEEKQTDPPPTSMKSLLKTGEIGCNQFQNATSEASLDCVPKTKFEKAEFADNKDDQRKLALVYWTELIDKGHENAATVEALLAAADALAKLGDLHKSQEFYARADDIASRKIARIESVKTRLVESRAPQAWLRQHPAPGAKDASHDPDGAWPPGLSAWLTEANTQTLLDTLHAAVEMRTRGKAQVDGTAHGRTRTVSLSAGVESDLATLERDARALLKARAVPRLTELHDHYRRYLVHAKLNRSQLSAAENVP